VIHERDGRTDRQTLRDSKDRAYASHRAVIVIWLALTDSIHKTLAHPVCLGTVWGGELRDSLGFEDDIVSFRVGDGSVGRGSMGHHYSMGHMGHGSVGADP